MNAPNVYQAWSTPLDSPSAPPFPFAYRNVDVLTLVYRTDPEAIARLIPAPLVPVSDWVLIHIYNMNDVDWIGKYGECNVMLGARLPNGTAGGFSPYLFLNSDGGLAQGREVHGQPKRWGNPRVDFRRDLIVGVLERNGLDVITGTMGYKQMRGELDDLRRETFDFSDNLNFKLIQNIDGTNAIRQITSRVLQDLRVHECWKGPCTVELRPHILAPIYRLPVRETGTAYFWRADFTLVPGKIIYTYPPDSSEAQTR